MTLAIIALIAGILSILNCWIPFVGIVLAVLGIIFGIVGRKQIVASGDGRTGIATAALIVSAIGAAFSIPWTLCGLCAGAAGCAEAFTTELSTILYLL